MREKKYKSIIIDDDHNFAEVISQYISYIPKLKLIKYYSDPRLALKEIDESDEIDFLFLDIKMQLSGIDVAKILRSKVKYLVFMTSYSNFAIDAFQAGGDQYLVKPFTLTKFIDTVNGLILKNHKQQSGHDYKV